MLRPALIVTSAIATAFIGTATTACTTGPDRDQRSYQMGYESADRGAGAAMARAGVALDTICQGALTSAYMFQDENFKLDDQAFLEGCNDALHKRYGS